MAHTEFYVDNATGANINAGDNKTLTTSTNGDWGNAAANRFTAASGTPFSGVSVGDFASVYLDGATTAVYIGRVTAVNAGGASLDISSTAKSGTAPAAGANGRSCTVGGKWAGPSGASGFPITFVAAAMTDASANIPRINIKSGTTYSITAAMTSAAGPLRFEGYTSSVGDGGRFTLDGGTSGASYTMWTTGTNTSVVNAIVQNNGATGGLYGLQLGTLNYLRNLVVNSVRGIGVYVAAAGSLITECEFYLCNQSNTAAIGAVYGLGACYVTISRCIFHDNAGSNGHGFYGNAALLSNCIFDSNAGQGAFLTVAGARVVGCDFYNNTGDGLRMAVIGLFSIENCNFLKNGGWAINGSDGTAKLGDITNCAFGAGTQVNTSGTSTGTSGMVISGSINYASNVTPWVDPANGDFRLNLAAAINAGRGIFTQTQASYAGTIAYPDIGAGQHLEAVGGGGGSVFGSIGGTIS